ncbi:MAG6450 family protein [Lactococcus formosensis]|uniref:MAG6450 family protein n=1 Tax=Lactococcus formosensis TaxID=1281486 RepID=UPI0032662B49
MASKLTNKRNKNQDTKEKLTNNLPTEQDSIKSLDGGRNRKKFKFALTGSLANQYSFKKLKPAGIKQFHDFLNHILMNQLTISDVEKGFLRTKGPVFSEEVFCGRKRKLIHFEGKDKKFRIHGYYNDEFYFVICKIDPNHKVHK